MTFLAAGALTFFAGAAAAFFADLAFTSLAAGTAASTAAWPDIDLAIPLPGQSHYANVTRKGLIDAGVALGLRPQISVREMDAVTSRIMVELDAIIAGVEKENVELPAQTHLYQGGELRLLRAIRHVIIGDMLKKLA